MLRYHLRLFQHQDKVLEILLSQALIMVFCYHQLSLNLLLPPISLLFVYLKHTAIRTFFYLLQTYLKQVYFQILAVSFAKPYLLMLTLFLVAQMLLLEPPVEPLCSILLLANHKSSQFELLVEGYPLLLLQFRPILKFELLYLWYLWRSASFAG